MTWQSKEIYEANGTALIFLLTLLDRKTNLKILVNSETPKLHICCGFNFILGSIFIFLCFCVW